MADLLTSLQSSLRLFFHRVLTRLYFFTQVAKAYESVLYLPLELRVPSRPPQPSKKKSAEMLPDTNKELDAKVEAALQKAAKVWQGVSPPAPKPSIPTSTQSKPPSKKPAPPTKPAAPPSKLHIFLNLDLMQTYRHNKKHWKAHRSSLLTQISKQNELATKAQNTFLMRINAKKRQKTVTNVEILIARSVSEAQICEEILKILSDFEIRSALTELIHKKDGNFDDLHRFVTILTLCEWLEREITALKESTAVPKLQELRLFWQELQGNRQGRGVTLDAQHGLLTRLKGLKVSQDLGKLLGCYAAWSLFTLQITVLSSANQLSESSSLEEMRILHSLIVKNGALLLTATLV